MEKWIKPFITELDVSCTYGGSGKNAEKNLQVQVNKSKPGDPDTPPEEDDTSING